MLRITLEDGRVLDFGHMERFRLVYQRSSTAFGWEIETLRAGQDQIRGVAFAYLCENRETLSKIRSMRMI